jgi:hypothetical protein
MCPPDQTDQDPDDTADDAVSGGADAAHEPNKVVGPLTDDELKAGGLGPIQAFARTDPTKEALRKKRQRKKQQADGKRQINIVVPDDDRSRATIRSAATAIEDEISHQAFEAILAKPDLAPLVADVATQAELREIIELARNMRDQRHSATIELLDTAKLVAAHPEIIALMTRATATSRMREAMELAVANPEFVLLGRIVATQRSVCAWLARLLLRVRRRPDATANRRRFASNEVRNR